MRGILKLLHYVTVEAANGTGMTSRAWSSGFVVDVAPPVLTFYCDCDKRNQSRSDGCFLWCYRPAGLCHVMLYKLHPGSNITGVQDNESGIKLCTNPSRNSTDFVTDFVDNGLSATVEATGLQLPAGQSYYTVVRCENSAGLSGLYTESVSSPVLAVDGTPPSKV